MWSESKGGKLCEWTLGGGKMAEHVAWAADLNAKTRECSAYRRKGTRGVLNLGLALL